MKKSKEAENKAKYKNINIALITSIIMIFVGVTGRFIYRKIKTKMKTHLLLSFEMMRLIDAFIY